MSSIEPDGGGSHGLTHRQSYKDISRWPVSKRAPSSWWSRSMTWPASS